MKKTIIILIIMLAFRSVITYSQPLQNSLWKVYHPEGIFFLFFYFHDDTLSTSFDNITYTDVGTGQVIGNNISVVDLPGGQCPVSDTGRYTYLVQNDTLKFTLVADQCTSRSTTMTTFHYVRFYTGIPVAIDYPTLGLFPNPSREQITIFFSPSRGINWLSIFNVTGEKVIEKQITDNEIQIDISALPRGVYFVRLQNEKMMGVEKIVKE